MHTLPRTGTFCWPELATQDQTGARSFYTALFGWTAFEHPMGERRTYTTLRLGGRDVAGLYPMGTPDQPPESPPHWLGYVAVENAAETAKRITEAGGTMVAKPFDVAELGRMAVALDSVGAVFAIWQPRQQGGTLTNEPGSLGWMQLNTTDPVKAEAFYTGVFGWTARRDPMPGSGDYHTFSTGGVPFAGAMPMPPGMDTPSHWLTYFLVADVDAANTRAVTLGATTFVPPTDIPSLARFAVLGDPQGAAFAVVKFTP